jgi:hypothetical protein
MKIIDRFPFFNEEECLIISINLIKDYVNHNIKIQKDCFIILK